MNLTRALRISFPRAFILLCGLVLFTLPGDQGALGKRHPAEPIRKTSKHAADVIAGDQTLRATARKTLMKSPLSFESNRGQFDTSIAFGARAAGGDLYLEAGEAVVA